MNKNYQNNTPSKNIINILKKIIAIFVSIIETRIKLISVELEKEKNKLINLLIIISLIIIFGSFTLLNFIILIILIIGIKYYIWTLIFINIILLLITISLIFFVVKKLNKNSILIHTRKELKKDSKSLKE